MELVNVTQELYATTRRLNKSSKEVFRLAKTKAEAERVYRMELAKRIVTLRSEKMPATLIGDIARGELSDLKYERDLSSDMYRSAISAMDALKVQVNALQSIAKYQSDI